MLFLLLSYVNHYTYCHYLNNKPLSTSILHRLMKSGINPFDSQEAKPYKNDPEILAMTNLVMAYQNNDINEFESILKHNRNNIMDDPFIREHIEDLLRNIRTQVLIKLIGPYTRIHIPFISKELNIDEKEVENLLVTCILDKLVVLINLLFHEYKCHCGCVTNYCVCLTHIIIFILVGTTFLTTFSSLFLIHAVMTIKL